MRRFESVSVLIVVAASISMLVSIFVPYWRVSQVTVKDFDGSNSFTPSFGITQVQVAQLQSWDELVQVTCLYWTLASVGPLASPCTKRSSQICNLGYFNHLKERCQGYQEISKISWLTWGVAAAGSTCVLLSILAIVIVKIERVGGFIFTIFMCVGVTAIATNIAWVVKTDKAFKKLGESAWFPFPALAWGYYMHLLSGLTLLGSTSLYGWKVLPTVFKRRPLELYMEGDSDEEVSLSDRSMLARPDTNNISLQNGEKGDVDLVARNSVNELESSLPHLEAFLQPKAFHTTTDDKEFKVGSLSIASSVKDRISNLGKREIHREGDSLRSLSGPAPIVIGGVDASQVNVDDKEGKDGFLSVGSSRKDQVLNLVTATARPVAKRLKGSVQFVSGKERIKSRNRNVQSSAPASTSSRQQIPISKE